MSESAICCLCPKKLGLKPDGTRPMEFSAHPISGGICCEECFHSMVVSARSVDYTKVAKSNDRIVVGSLDSLLKIIPVLRTESDLEWHREDDTTNRRIDRLRYLVSLLEQEVAKIKEAIPNKSRLKKRKYNDQIS